MKKTLYLCDPAKNVTCRRLFCKHDPSSKFRNCECTTEPACAATDSSGNLIVRVRGTENETDLHVSRHAEKRTKQRIGVNKSSTEKNAARAFEHGVRHSQTKGSLRRYLDRLYAKERTANQIRIYNYYVYLFSDHVLITVFMLPQKYRRSYDRIKASHKRVEA